MPKPYPQTHSSTANSWLAEQLPSSSSVPKNGQKGYSLPTFIFRGPPQEVDHKHIKLKTGENYKVL